MFNYEGKDQDYMNFAEYMRTLGKMPSQEYTNAYMSQMNPEALGEANMEPEQPQDDSWGGFRGFAAGGAGVLQGQAQLGNLAGFGDGSTANYMGEIMQRNARKKEYTIADMFPFASDYWTSGEGAAYDIGNMLGSSVVLGGETALAAATGGAALGALGVGNAAAAAATAAGGSATAARAAFMTKAITGGMGRAAAKMGMPKLGKVLEGPVGTLYALNILKTPLEASSEAGNAGAEALANGASLSDAQRQALIVGGLQMPLLALSNSIESSGLGGLFLKEAEKAGGKKLGKEGLLAILGNITREGVNNAWEEGMQQSTHEYAQGKQNLLGVVNPFQWSDEALQQAAVGGVGGLAIGGGNAAMRAFGTRGGDEAATPQAQEAAEAQENTTMPETPAQEEPAPVAPSTPAESAAEYLDTISQQDGNLSMEQRRGIWDVLDSGDGQAIIDTATQFGWQPPVEQAAPVTPATTPEQQIQTAIDNVNAATANVANGGEAVEPAATRPPMPVVESISGGGKGKYPTNPPTFGVAENPVDQNGVKVWLNSVSRAAHEKLSKGNKTRKYLDSDGNINTMALRASPALRRFIDGNPNAVENLKAALSGNKEAMAWFSKLSPTRQAALVDVLNHGVENWQVTDGDRRSFALYDLRQQLYQKAKNLKGKVKTKLYASLKNSDDNELIKIAKEHGLEIPDIVYGKSEPTAPISTPTQPVSNNTAEPNIETATNAPIEEPAIEPNASGGNAASAINAIINGNNGNAATPAAPATSTDTNGATPARNKRLAPISIGGVQTIPQVSSDGTKLAFSLPEVFLPMQTVDDMKAAGFFYNSELKAIVADNTETAQNFLKKYAAKESGNDINNGGKENETDKNGEGNKGGDQGSENPVQNKQPKEPVKAKTGDDQGEDKNGETGEVDTPKSEPEKTTDENGVTPIPHDAKPDAVKKLQQANTEIIMGKVKAIEKQYEDGELDANAARKAISAFFQKYSQSKAVNKAYSAGTDEKINSIKKGITAKEAEKKRAAAANAASADKQAKEEAKQKKKKLYQDTLSEFDEKANAVLSKHKEQELSDVDAIAELDKITKELEERLVANDDKLLVKDKKSFYEDRVKTIKKQQAEIDKAILEAATTEAIAGSSESLTPEGLEAYKWVKQQLSADAKKRYSEKGIDAVAALIAFRAQTWSKLYNKYAKTNFTPLTFAQRYKFVLHDGRIPKFEKSGGVTHTIEELSNKQSHIDMAITSDEGVLVHELGHVFFADFVAVAESPDAPAQLKKDLAILREWIGDGQRSEEELKKPYRQSAQAAGKWHDEERFSQALVKHVYAGDTPVPWLNKMFAELKSILESYIKGVQYRINKALASPEKTKETEGYAKAYRTDFEIPAEIKRIINEMIYYKEADAVTYDDKMQVIKALNNELDATFIEEQPPDTKRFNELKQRIAAVGKGSKEYSPEQNAVLEAASKACQTKAELGLLEQKARIAYNEVEEGKVSDVNVESAASALLEGNPMEFETIPKEACDLLLKGLDEQQRNDVVDLDVEEEVARAVVVDYAVEGKLDDAFEQLCDDLKASDVEEDGIKSVEKYADYVLCMLHKYAAIYNKQKKLEEAEKAYEDAVAALKKAEAEKKLKELVDKKGEDGNKGEDSNTTPNTFDYLPEETRKSKLGKAMYQAAWHGSPHIIEGNLTTERIGTGEGAIVHGWGLYFAKARSTAQENYRERLREYSYTGEATIRNPETGETFSWNLEESEKLFEEDDAKYYKLSSEMTEALNAFKEKGGDMKAALNLLSRRKKNALGSIELWENTFPASDEEVAAYKKAEEAFYKDDIDLFDSNWVNKLNAKMSHAPVPVYSAEEIEEHLLAAEEDYKALESAERIAKSIDISKAKEGGELLKVELPENDVLLNEQYKFERQPFRVRAALERIFEKLPTGETPTNGWKDGVRALKDLLVTDDDEVVYKLLLPFYEKYNADFAESGPENYHDRESELHKEVSRLVSDIVDESTKEIREIINRENAGKKENEIDWYDVVNKVYKQLDEKQKAIDGTGIFDTMEEFGLDYTIASMKRNIVYDLTQRHNSELFKPFSLPTKTRDERKLLKGKTGYDIYRMLGRALAGSQDIKRGSLDWGMGKLASVELNKHGVKGIHYEGAVDGECFVIFDDNAIAIQERYDAALRRRGAELQRSREEVVGNIKKMFAGSKFDEQENGDLLITTKNGKKLLYKISDRIVLNEAEAQEARKAHGISENVEVTAEGRYRPVYESDIDSIVEVGLDSRKNTEAHEATHAVIDLALGKEKAKPLFDRAEKLKKEYGLKADAEEIACDAVRDFVTARGNGFITTFTTKEVAELKKTFWGRMLLKGNIMGAKAKVFSDKNEAELKKTVWGKMLLAKMQLQRGMAKLMRAVYDFYKRFQAVREANDNFHNLARKIELGEVWGEKANKDRTGSGDKYQSVLRNAPDTFLSDEQKEAYKKDGENFIKDLHNDKVSPTSYVKMTSSPLILQKLGYSANDIVMLKSKALTAMKPDGSESHAHGLTDKMMAEAAMALHEPVFVMQSKTRPNDSIVVFTEIKDGKGRSIIVPIQITKNENGIANVATSEYGRNSEEMFIAKQFVGGRILYANSKKGPAWAEPTRLRLPLGLLKQSLNLEQSIAQDSQKSNTKFSVRYTKKDKDIQVSSINLNYKKQLEDAFARNATDGEIAYIMNQHQKELASYFKDKDDKQKERAKLRAAEIRSLRKKLHAKEIESFALSGAIVRLDKDGKEVVEKINNGLPNRTYENKRHENEDFKNASASAKLGAAIKREKPKTMLQSAKDWLKEAKDNFYKQWVDKYDALRIFDKAIEDKNGKPVHAEQTVLGKMQMVANYASGAARAIIEGDKHSLKPVADTYHIKNLTSLKDMMEKLMADCKAGKFKDYVKSANLDGDTSIQGYINALENYLTALTLLESSQNHKLDYDREVAEWQNKGARGKKPEFEEYKFPNNMTEDEIKDIIRSAPKEFRQYQVIFKGFTDNLLDIMLNSGLITADRYDTLKTRYKFYCPLMRDFSDTAAVDDFISQINSGKGLGNVSDPLKSRSSGGSVRDVISPLTTAVKTASAICTKAERNRVGQYMVRQAKKHRLDEFVHEVKGNSGDANNCIFTVMINGEKHAYQTTPELYPAITAAVEPLCKIQMALLTKPAQLLRAGSTMSPSFIIRNFLRDTLFASVASKNGFIPIYDSIRGGYALLKNRERRGEFDAAGVISSNFYSDAEAIQKSLTEMAGGKSWQELTSWEIVKALVSKPIAGLEWISNLIEASTRMGEFMRARDKGKSVEEAAYDAVEITLNFGRSGATGQQINRMIPFFNACIQGGDKLYRLFKSDPKTTMLRIGTYIILPSIVLWAANHDEDWYKELDPAIKMNNWILPGGSIRIPKPQEAGVLFGSGFEAALDAAAGQDQKAMKEWATTFLENMTPGVMPTLILPLIEWMANYSFFRNKPVVSQSMQRLPDELQYGPYTSETSKFVGGIAGVSPAKLDNFWRGYTGTMGMFLIQAPDLWAADKQNLPEKKLSEMAFVRDFAINDMNLNRTMNDFYRLKEAATKQHAGYGKKGKPTAEVAGVNVAAQSISKLQKEAREITASPKYNSAQKRVLVDKLQAKQKKIAQLCIKKYGNKFDY